MTVVDAIGPTFREEQAERKVESVPLSHLSVELGHLYMEDFNEGYDALRRHFARVAPWVTVATASGAGQVPGRKARVSTCFLIDDYFTRFSSPLTVVRNLERAAAENKITIDYIARESACATLDGVDVARLVADRLVVEPTPETTGVRPPVTESGWLSNGQRSPVSGAAPAMAGLLQWKPPVETAANRHSIFMDVQLWDDDGGRRTWSCPFLAAVWQLLRLGLLRHRGEGLVRPVPMAVWLASEVTDDWDRMPPVLQLNARAAPFGAYRTMSVLASRYLPVEHAVRTILNHVAVEAAVLEQVEERSQAEGMKLPAELVERISYYFAGG